MIATLAERVQVALVKDTLPGLFAKPGRMLYVGANPIRHYLADEFKAAEWHIELLEVCHANLMHYSNGGPFDKLTLGDVREMETGTYDVVFWWHGPEHIERGEIPDTLKRLEAVSNNIVLGCPWGVYQQGAEYGNPYEEHKATLYPADFEAWGYEVATCGEADSGNGLSHILAWK